ADGYSRPYQISMWLSSLVISILGLFILGKILTRYFTPVITGWVILILGLATNYFEYAAISNGMNHTWLFTLLCALIWMSIRFYEKSDWTSAISIGVIMGLVCLTRPTEIIWALIPLCWNMDSISGRLRFLQQ